MQVGGRDGYVAVLGEQEGRNHRIERERERERKKGFLSMLSSSYCIVLCCAVKQRVI
jgi:hypothetical protein